MGTTVAPDKTLDLTGHACALVLAKTKLALDEMASGKILEVLTTDACTEYDIPSWVTKTGKEMVDTVKEQGVLRFFIKKT